MKRFEKAKIEKAASGIIAIMMLVCVLFFAFFIASHESHDCVGEDCPVCACLQQCENILNGAGGGLVFLAAGILPAILVIGCILVSYCIYFSDTPVSTKVRMNN